MTNDKKKWFRNGTISDSIVFSSQVQLGNECGLPKLQRVVLI